MDGFTHPALQPYIYVDPGGCFDGWESVLRYNPVCLLHLWDIATLRCVYCGIDKRDWLMSGGR